MASSPGIAQLEGGHRQGEGAEADHTEDQYGQRAAQYEPGPAGAAVVLGLFPGTARPAVLAAQHRVRPEAEERRDQGQRDQYGDGDRARRGQAHLGEHRNADHREPGEGDDDGETREDDRGTGRTDREGRRLLGCPAPGAFLPVPGDDEQGVVDADGEPQHHREGAGGGGQAEGVGEGEDRGHADADADERGQQRQSGRGQ
ncbi:hypothetical protein QF027_005056 [Streptomyces canus]|nr:hypothetical protein [Streptomyces canus]